MSDITESNKEVNNLVSDEVDVAANEYLTKFSVNRNFVKLLSNDAYLESKVKDDESTVYSYNQYKSYKEGDLVFFKTSLSAQNTYLLCSLTSSNNFTPSCEMNVAGEYVVVNDNHWKMVGVPALDELSGHSPTDIADEYILTSREDFETHHQDDTHLSAHPLGKFCRQSSQVLFTDMSNLSSGRSTLFYPYRVQKLASDDTILDGYMRKWDNGILEYDIVFRVGYQGKTDEGYDHLEANNTSYVNRNLNYMYFKTKKDYGMFNQGGDLQAMVNNQKQTNLNNVINAYVGQIVFPEEFKDLNYMVFSSNTKGITTRTYNTKNDVIPYDELDTRLSVSGLTIANHKTLSSEEEEKKLYDTPVNVHISVQNITEEAMAYISNRYEKVQVNMLSNSCLTNIDDRAFFSTEIATLTIPFSVRHIGAQAFAKCQKLKHIDFYVEQDPTLHPKIELGAFSNTTLLSSINVIYRPTTRTMFGASPLDDPETQRLSTYNDIPLNEKLSNDLIRTHIYGISPDFDVANIKTTGYAPALMSRPMLAVSSPTSTCTRSQESVEPSGPSEEGSGDTESENLNFVTIDVKQFLAELELERSGMTSSSKRVAMSAPVPVAASPTPATLTTFFEFNDDKTELTNWKHDQLTDEFEFDSVALFTGTECSTVTSIADFALSGCTALTSFRAGWPIKRIGYASLSGCTGLDNIVLSDSVIEVGSYSFAGCGNVENASISGSSSRTFQSNSFEKTQIETLSILPQSVFDGYPLVVTATNVCVDMAGCYFGAKSFEGSMVRVFSVENIKDGVEKTEVTPPISGFAYNAFAGCHMKKLYAANDDLQEVSSVFQNPDIAYTGVNPLNILSLENASLVQIQNKAERYDVRLWVKFLVVSGDLDDIPYYLSVDDDLNVISCDMSEFYDEDGGGQLELNYGFISICANAFEPGESTEKVLTGLVIPQTVSAIGDYAFSGNKSLEFIDIEIGTDFRELGHDIVSACESLNDFTVLSAS